MVKKWQLGVCVLCVLCLAFSLGIAGAQEQDAAGSTAREEFQSQVQEIQEQRNTMHENAQAAKEEERQLKQQMEAAISSGDFETAKEIRGQLHATHQENIQQMHQDIQAIQETKQGFNPSGPGSVNPLRTGRIAKDKLENIRDRREDIKDRREDIKDRREDIRDKKEDIWDRRHDGGKMDRLEDIRDRREDIRDRREDVRDRRENVRDRRENIRDRSISPAGAGQHRGPAVMAPRQQHPAANKQGGAGRRR